MSDTYALCRQIAAALDITPDELLAVQAAKERAAELSEIAELLRDFQQLSDQGARRRCISYVRAEVLRSKSASNAASPLSAIEAAQ